MENGVKEKAYMALYARVREAITGGIYRWGGKLPSKRAMAERYGVSVITVEHAYALLAEEGYVEPRERSGYFIIYKEEDAFPVGYRGKEVKPVLPSETDEEVFPFSVYAKTARTVLSKWGEKVLARSPNQGTAELRNALCDYLARSRNIIVSPQQICIGSGAEYLYSLVVQALGRERLVAVEDPCYEKIRQVYRAHGIRTESLRLGDKGILTEELKRAGARVLHVTPFHSYPSGITANASKRREYIRWAEERSGLIIEDDFDSEFTLLSKAEDTLFSLAPHGPVVYMNTFSRTIAPSVRVAYLVLPENRLSRFQERTGCSISGVGGKSCSISWIAWYSFRPERKMVRYAFLSQLLTSGVILFLASPTLFSPTTLAGLPSTITNGHTSCTILDIPPTMAQAPIFTNWWIPLMPPMTAWSSTVTWPAAPEKLDMTM